MSENTYSKFTPPASPDWTEDAAPLYQSREWWCDYEMTEPAIRAVCKAMMRRLGYAHHGLTLEVLHAINATVGRRSGSWCNAGIIEDTFTEEARDRGVELEQQETDPLDFTGNPALN